MPYLTLVFNLPTLSQYLDEIGLEGMLVIVRVGLLLVRQVEVSTFSRRSASEHTRWRPGRETTTRRRDAAATRRSRTGAAAAAPKTLVGLRTGWAQGEQGERVALRGPNDERSGSPSS